MRIFVARWTDPSAPEQCTEVARSGLTCLPTVADLTQRNDDETINIIVRKQLDDVITKHVHHGDCEILRLYSTWGAPLCMR